jgi:hypothetical protein
MPLSLAVAPKALLREKRSEKLRAILSPQPTSPA